MPSARQPPPGCDPFDSLPARGGREPEERPMRLYIETMDAVLVAFEPDGQVRLDDEDWSTPTLQERRAILHAAQTEIEMLRDLMLALDPDAVD